MTDAIATYLANSEAAARVLFERAHKAKDRASAYHRKNYAAARLVSHAYQADGFSGVLTLREHLVRTEADRTILQEVRRLARGADERLEGPPPGAH